MHLVDPKQQPLRGNGVKLGTNPLEEGWQDTAAQPTGVDSGSNLPGLAVGSSRYIGGGHFEGANFLYADGHVKWSALSTPLRQSQISPSVLPPFTTQGDN